MTKSKNIIIIFISLFSAILSAEGQSVDGEWTGYWHGCKEDKWTIERIVFTQRENKLSGSILWRLDNAGNASHVSHLVGRSATEYFEGSIQGKDITIIGKSKDDNYNLIGLDVYKLTIRYNNGLKELTGRSSDYGCWQAKFYAKAKVDDIVLRMGSVSGQVFDKQTRKPVKSTLSIIGDKSPIQTILTLGDGKYSYNAPISDISDISITEDGYEPLRESINIDRSVLTKNFFLIPKPASVETNIEPKRDEPVVLKNVLFKLSTATLLSQSFPELDRLASLMQNRPSMNIRLEGHTDRIGDTASNLKLSQDRVMEVKRYLIQKGISDTRITTKGYGDTKTICNPPCEANRRVEFVVIEQ